MIASTQTASPSTSRPVRLVVSAVLKLAGLPLLLLLPAGTWRWPEAWAVSALWIVYGTGAFLWLVDHDQELLRERLRWSPVQRGQKRWDAFWSIAALLVGMGLLVMPGLDVVRFGWSRLPGWMSAVALVVHLPVFFVVFSTLRANTFLSRVVKIDAGRGHHVVTTGPYGVVRHPMYAASILLFFAMPVALGSLWTLPFSVVMAVLVVVRTHLEDRTLHAELPGYADYARRTRYRLVPGLW